MLEEDDAIRTYFDEESEDEETIISSPPSDFNQSELDLAREPLASSSKRSIKQQHKPKPKSKRRRETSITSSREPFTNRNVEESSRRKKNAPRKLILKEIRKYQQNTDFLIPKLPFSRVIREILMSPRISTNYDLRITVTALEALQEIAEMYLTIFFQDSYRCSLHRGRITLIKKDMELVRTLRGVDDLGYME